MVIEPGGPDLGPSFSSGGPAAPSSGNGGSSGGGPLPVPHSQIHPGEQIGIGGSGAQPVFPSSGAAPRHPLYIPPRKKITRTLPIL